MTVIVDYDKNGNAIFRSATGVGTPDAERERAYKLDKLIQKKLGKLSKKLEISKKTSGRNKVEMYWEFGNVLRSIYYDSGLINPSEKNLFWLNVRIHASEKLIAKDRGPNRIHVEYCFRLAGYSKKIAIKREWSEWVYLFDSPFINKEPRFDRWDESNIKIEIDYVRRENTRFFIQCLNSMLKNIETSDLEEKEVLRCYDAAWLLTKTLVIDSNITESSNSKLALKIKISENKNYVGKLIEGTITPIEFNDIMSGEILSDLNQKQ